MKMFFILCLLCLSLSLFAAEVQIKVSGMVCSLCAQGIHKKMSSLTAVKEIKVNMDEKLVTLITKDGQDIPDETIRTLISEAGYHVAAIERK
jgi:mercuric ion binding protein